MDAAFAAASIEAVEGGPKCNIFVFFRVAFSAVGVEDEKPEALLLCVLSLCFIVDVFRTGLIFNAKGDDDGV